MADEAENSGSATAEKAYVIDVPGIEQDGEQATLVMRALDDNAWAVFARVHEQLKLANRLPQDQRVQFAIRNVALIMQSLQLSIVDEADQVWIDSLLMSGQLSAIDAMGLVAEVARQHYATESDKAAPATGPVRLRR